MKKAFAGSLLCLMVLLTAASTLAVDNSNLTLTDTGVIVKHPAKVITPAAGHDPSLKTITATSAIIPTATTRSRNCNGNSGKWVAVEGLLPGFAYWA